jgi:ribonuclease HI
MNRVFFVEPRMRPFYLWIKKLINKHSLNLRTMIDYYVYTDGACSNNGRAGAVSGIGIYFGQNDERNVSQRIDGKQTNNTAELGAILCLYPLIRPDLEAGKRVGIVTDSIYVIRCVTTYGQRCEAEGWKKDIPNKAMVRQVYERYKYYGDKVKFIHVLAHTGATDAHSIGNACADKLATDATQNA